MTYAAKYTHFSLGEKLEREFSDHVARAQTNLAPSLLTHMDFFLGRANICEQEQLSQKPLHRITKTVSCDVTKSVMSPKGMTRSATTE